MFDFLRRFLRGESGAVTVDWVVLTAAVVALAISAFFGISGGVDFLTTDTATYLEQQDLQSQTNIQDLYSALGG